MEKINEESICEAYNKARMQHIGHKQSPEQVKEILKSFGISGSLCRKMLSNSTLFNKSKRENAGKGRHLCYIFSYQPIHVSWFKNWLYPPIENKESSINKKDRSFEEECAAYLKQQGYQLKKCTGFDEDAFKKDYPQLYEKYLIYENV
jgi:hypothetical protein